MQKVSDVVKIISSTLTPYLVAFTPDECKTLPKMSDGTLPFVKKAQEYATTNPSFVPPYIDVTELPSRRYQCSIANATPH